MNLNNKKHNYNQGFTMLELVIIVSLLLVLGAAVTIWIDPVTRIGQAKDAKRREAVMALSAAFTDYAQSHKGALPILGAVTTEKKVICNTQSGAKLTCDGSTEYCLKIDDASFFTKNITNLPIDPDKSVDSNTGYYIKKDANDNISIGACDYDVSYVYDRPQLRATCDAYGGGYCWYGGGESTASCDTICAANNLTCVSAYTADTLCLIGDAGSTDYTCLSGCIAGASGKAPGWSDDNSCAYQLNTLNCSGSNDIYAVCPCQ